MAVQLSFESLEIEIEQHFGDRPDLVEYRATVRLPTIGFEHAGVVRDHDLHSLRSWLQAILTEDQEPFHMPEGDPFVEIHSCSADDAHGGLHLGVRLLIGPGLDGKPLASRTHCSELAHDVAVSIHPEQIQRSIHELTKFVNLPYINPSDSR